MGNGLEAWLRVDIASWCFRCVPELIGRAAVGDGLGVAPCGHRACGDELVFHLLLLKLS